MPAGAARTGAQVEIAVPSEATPVNAIVSQRRGQLLGFDAREGWQGWDVVGR